MLPIPISRRLSEDPWQQGLGHSQRNDKNGAVRKLPLELIEIRHRRVDARVTNLPAHEEVPIDRPNRYVAEEKELEEEVAQLRQHTRLQDLGR